VNIVDIEVDLLSFPVKMNSQLMSQKSLHKLKPLWRFLMYSLTPYNDKLLVRDSQTIVEKELLLFLGLDGNRYYDPEYYFGEDNSEILGYLKVLGYKPINHETMQIKWTFTKSNIKYDDNQSIRFVEYSGTSPNFKLRLNSILNITLDLPERLSDYEVMHVEKGEEWITITFRYAFRSTNNDS